MALDLLEHNVDEWLERYAHAVKHEMNYNGDRDACKQGNRPAADL
jgi:hypothetical protein